TRSSFGLSRRLYESRENQALPLSASERPRCCCSGNRRHLCSCKGNHPRRSSRLGVLLSTLPCDAYDRQSLPKSKPTYPPSDHSVRPYSRMSNRQSRPTRSFWLPSTRLYDRSGRTEPP